ncbi:DNA transposase THAP9 [Orchesella cincta]|uniref:DNA transposase THAP9 n=1 Tax=Orchesella cincta TaxID=48709 RepID=A0A1D2N2T1_ORCCI|nr:DNA transposase THAP9 [Orchesella cincta]
MAIRVQILHKDNKIVGFVDGGGLTSFKNTAEHAKNAFFVVATEINGNKSIPIAYILTRGLQASQITDVLAKCLHAMHNAGGKVISITFDGLPANFKAMESMGANFELGTERFKTFIEHPSTNERIYLMPDSSHMFKLVRNNFKACKILKNGKDEVINWGFIARLQEIQDFEGVRAGNKLTKAHVQFERKKMNTRLMAHTLSHSSSTGITTCRVLNIDGFQGSEATCEFLDTCDKLFDMFNSKSRGIGLKTPMKNSNSAIWAPFLKEAKEYFLTLQCKPKGKDQYTPVYKTTKGTFVKGIVTNYMLCYRYLPTYRQSQDPIEILFGKFRARLGFNNNPNSVQLEHALKATLCYSIHACTTGNCIELDELSNRINPMRNLTAWGAECEEDEAVDEGKEVDDATFALLQDLPSFDNLSLFVENVVVYIAGFVGKRLQKSLKCSQCKSLLVPENLDNLKLRSDYVLLNTKNRGGLFCPSADLIKVCMIAEKKIRVNLAMGLSKVSGAMIEHAVVQTCLDSVFENSYSEHEISDLSKYEKMIGHRTTLVREITKYYITIRLHYAAKLKSSELVAEKKRSFYNKLGHFQGY